MLGRLRNLTTFPKRPDVIVFLIFSSVFLVLALLESKHLLSKEDYFVAGRKASSLQVGFSVIASCVGASATIGMCGLAFSVGFPAIWWLLSGAIGLSILNIFLLKKLRRRPCLTMLETVKERLGGRATKLCTFIIVLAWVAILVAQFSAMSSIVEQMTGSDAQTSLFLGAFVILLYTLIGGQATVIKSDVIQLSVMMIGLAVLLFALIHASPQPLSAFRFELLNDQFQTQDLSRFALLIGGSYVVCPMLFSRFMSARSDEVAHKGAMIAIVGLIFLAILFVLIGIQARDFLPSSTPSDQVLAAVAAQLPLIFQQILFLILISAILSSADSCLLTAATVVSNDLIRNPSIKTSRLVMCVLTLVALLLSSSERGILDLLLMANNMYVCAVIAPVFAAVFSSRLLNRPIIITTIILCGLIAFWAEWTGHFELTLMAFVLSVIGTSAAAYFEPMRSSRGVCQKS